MGSLIAGANAALTAENPGLVSVLVGLGWEMVPSRGPQSELVPLTLLCGLDNRVLSNEHLVFFNQIASPSGAVQFVGDKDTEQIDVHLPQVPDAVTKIVFAVYADPEMRGPGSFAAVRRAHIRITRVDGSELVRFDLPSSTGDSITAMLFGELYRYRTDWKFRALGQGYTTGLRGLAADFGFRL